jgi:hypothetical protein
VPVVLMLGAKFSGLPSEQYTKVLAPTWPTARSAGSANAQSAVRLSANLPFDFRKIIFLDSYRLMLHGSGFDNG